MPPPFPFANRLPDRPHSLPPRAPGAGSVVRALNPPDDKGLPLLQDLRFRAELTAAPAHTPGNAARDQGARSAAIMAEPCRRTAQEIDAGGRKRRRKRQSAAAR